jgi:hypothetical protein
MEIDDLTALRDGSAWAAFCADLLAAGEVLRVAAPALDDLSVAEGHRYLTRLARSALEQHIEYRSPEAPALLRGNHETIKGPGFDNPDQVALLAAINGAHEYRIRGRRGTVVFLSFATYYGGDYGRSGRSGRGGSLDASQLQLNADGSFEIAVSVEPRPGNWLPMDPETHRLMIRQLCLDRSVEVLAELAIERVDADGPPPPLKPTDLRRGLAAASRYVLGSAQVFAEWSREFASRPNQMQLMDRARMDAVHADPAYAYVTGGWTLDEHEVLLVEFTPPACEYWSLTLYNYWLETPDYRHHKVSVNAATAHPGPDGRVRIAVSARDTGLGDWIDTAGHRSGALLLRWVQADSHPVPVCTVISSSSPVSPANA